MVERVTYEGLPDIVGPYVHTTKHNKTLYVSGLTAYGTDAQHCDITTQTQEIMRQIANILQHEKCSKRDLLKLTIFVRDISQLTNVRELLFEFYEGYLPACSLVEVSKLIAPELHIEIEAIVAM